LKLNIVIVLFNDNGYNLIKWKSMKKFGTSFGVDFTNPDFVTFAESFGAVGLRLKAAGDFRRMLQEALAMEGPVIIDVPIDYSDNELIYKLL
jgi:acetolactate synthase-1/2/3 large subunit